MSVYAKLFSRITESSIMEEPIGVRYCFVMLLAICDPSGHVIGTDVAIARRINMPLADFKEAMRPLLSPDPHSNSQEEDGRRCTPSDGERGYKVVNYLTYRDMRDEDERREYMRAYMRDYMRKKRGSKLLDSQIPNGKEPAATLDPLNNVKPCLAHAEAEAEAEAKTEAEKPPNPQRGNGREKKAPESEQAQAAAVLFHRALTKEWTPKEIKSFKAIGAIDISDLALIGKYYAFERSKGDEGIHRRDLQTFLNNYHGELDRARQWEASHARKSANLNGAARDYPAGFDLWLAQKYPGRTVADISIGTREQMISEFRKAV